MDIDAFVRRRTPGWRRLEQLLDAADASPEWELGHARIQEIVALYRQACSDLNQARSYTANPDLLGHLNRLAGRGYRFLYGGTLRTGAGGAVRRFLLADVPATFRAERRVVLVAAACLAVGALLGFCAVVANPANGEAIIPAEFFTESPRERVEDLEGGPERVDTLEKAAAFGSFLYTHNIHVAFLAFSLGALTIAGGAVLLLYNGVILGAVAAMYVLDGVGVFFAAWVGPHGVLELPAIVFSGAAGLRAGLALLAPGNRSRAAALREAFPVLWRMMVASALILVAAGVIEGSFSQFSSRTLPYAVKIASAALLFAALMAFLFLSRSRRTGEGA